MRPGINVAIRDVPPPRSVPTDTGQWFVCGLTERGELGKAIRITSMREYEAKLGPRGSYGMLYDALDVFFREGGRVAYVGRVAGPAAAVAGPVAVLNATAGTTLNLYSRSPGAWSADLDVTIENGPIPGTFFVNVIYQNKLVERSPELNDRDQAYNWAFNQSEWIFFLLGTGTGIPAPATYNLLTSSDDRANINDARWELALEAFTKDLGPGQVSFPGQTTANLRGLLMAHADELQNRIALLDYANSSSASTLMSTATTDRQTVGSRQAAVFGPWAIVPGLIPGTTRVVPYSAIQAGILARNDVSYSPGTPGAGRRGESLFCVGLVYNVWTDQEREDLNDNGFNVARVLGGRVVTYGFRSLANGATDPNWVNLAHGRLIMDIVTRGSAILEQHMFEEIDGQGILFSTVKGELTALLQRYWERRSLYGARASDAFIVDLDSVNTPATIAARELHAAVAIRPTEMAEMIWFEITNVPVNQNLV